MHLNNKLPLYTAIALSMYAPGSTYSATLAERAVYDMKILVGGDPAEVGQCSAFTFGDVRNVCGENIGPFVDNEETSIPEFDVPGGNGIEGDGIAGTIRIETDKANALGENTFSIVSYQVDPYLNTPGGTFKTTVETLGLGNNTGGTLDAVGNMTMDVTGRTGVTAKFFFTIGEQPWNVDDSAAIDANGDPTTGIWEPFTTGSSSNSNPTPPGGPEITLTGRPIGDANNDTILDAILISAGNVGQAWGDFDGTPYSEAFNVQYELISAKPVANPDSLNGNQDTPLVINEATDLLVNDTHALNDVLSFSDFTQPAEPGSAIIDNDDGTLTYTPAAGFSGQDTFSYTIADSAAETDTTTVTINLSAVGNNPPVANDLNVVTDEDKPLDIDPTVNDTDDDGDDLTVTDFDNPTVEGGTVADQGNNILTYNPPANFNGMDSFGYTISDGNGGTDKATVLITVNPVNDPLVCTDVNFITPLDTSLAIDVDADLLSTCTDPEGDAISLASTTQPAQPGSTLNDDGAGTLTYDPAPGFTGNDSFTYTATDGTDSDTRTVFIDVGKVLGNFTMLDSSGITFGGTNDVATTWDGSLNTAETDTNFNMTMKTDSDFPFFGFVWFAHDIRVFGPGNYSFDTSCTVPQLQAGVADCGGAPDEFLDLNVGAGQIGAHMLFDWNQTENIDVVLLWDMDGVFTNPDPAGALYLGPAGPTPSTDCVYEFVSRDVDGDTVPGAKMIDGPFIGFRANFNVNLTRNCEAVAGAGAQKSRIDSPDTGCSIRNAVVVPSRRSDLLLLLAFTAWLGWRRRTTNR